MAVDVDQISLSKTVNQPNVTVTIVVLHTDTAVNRRKNIASVPGVLITDKLQVKSRIFVIQTKPL